MTSDSDLSNMLDNSPSIVNINITCQPGSSVSLTNNLTVPESVNADEFTNDIPITQTQTQTHTLTQPHPQTTQNFNTPISTAPPPGLEPSNSRMLFTVNPSPNNQNINNITQNLLNSIFSGTNNTVTETVTFIPNTQSVQQQQPPSDGLTLNDLRNYTTLTTGDTPTTEIKCEICHDMIQDGDILRMINVCNHSFHQECVDSWFENNKICPYCRCNVMEEPIHTGNENGDENGDENDDNNVSENT